MLAGGLELVQVIGPPLSHALSLVPVLSTVIAAPHRSANGVCQGFLDGVSTPQTGFVELRAGHCAEAMGRHFLARIAQAAQSGIDGVFRHRTVSGVECGEHILLPLT